MTPPKSGHTNVVVVDGSNIATEGRSMPSLAQLNDAVLAFKEENPDAVITVVVDATFGHRIEKKELAEFDAAVAHNELVAPPAGAIGRGDAFVLSIANKVNARILSNDSFQEFHGEYPWLFEEGRLIGGKPVPYVGWVFVERLPVKGAVSRKATRAARGGREARPSRRSASREASQPMPVPSAPPPGSRRNDRGVAAAVNETAEADLAPAARPASPGTPVNDLLPFLDFVEHHPVGSSVNGVVESYSSHGAYVTVGDIRGYVPLRLMGDPPPRSAREVLKIGDAATLVVTSFAPGRRSVDLAIPKAAPVTDVVPSPVLEEIAETVASEPPVRKRGAKRAAAPAEVAPALSSSEMIEPVPEPATTEEEAPRRGAAAKKAPGRKTAARKAAAKVAASPRQAPGAEQALAAAIEEAAAEVAAVAPEAVAEAPAPPTRKAASKRAANQTSAETVPAKQAGPRKVAAKVAAKKVAAKEDPGEQTPAEHAPVEEPAARKTAAKKATGTKAPAKKAPAKAPAKKAAAKTVAAKKVAAKKVAAKKVAAKKAPAKKAPAKRAAATKRTAAAPESEQG